MTLLTIYTAAKEKGAPSKPYLIKLSQSDNRPDYFVQEDGVWRIDVDSVSWKEYVNDRRNGGGRKGTAKKKELSSDKLPVAKNAPPVKPPKDTNADTLDLADLKKLKLQADLEEKNIKNEILYLEMQKKSGNIIDFELAKYLFFSYMEKANVDFLRMAKKNEALIDNFVKDGNTRGVLDLIEQEATCILMEIKKSQKDSLEKWEREEAIKK